VQNPLSVTILLKGPNKHTITQLKDAVHDGLRAVKNAIEDKSVVPGGGAFEVAVNAALTSPEFMNSVQGRVKYGIKVRESNRKRSVMILEQRDSILCWHLRDFCSIPVVIVRRKVTHLRY